MGLGDEEFFDFKRLKKWNLSMGLLQLAMGVFLCIVFANEDLFTVGRPLLEVGVSKEEVNATTFKLGDTLETGKPNYYPAECCAFFFLTATFHLIYAFLPAYEDWIVGSNNFLRWIEYSITATIMIRTIAVQSGVREETTLIMLTAANIGVMLQGQIVEAILSKKSDLTRADKSALWTATAAGWIVMLAEFAVIIKQFLTLTNSVAGLDCEGLEIPSFVVWIIVTQCIFFSAFGFIQLWHISKRFKDANLKYDQIEIVYLIFSLLSKFTLGSILAFSVLGAERGAFGTFTCPTT